MRCFLSWICCCCLLLLAGCGSSDSNSDQEPLVQREPPTKVIIKEKDPPKNRRIRGRDVTAAKQRSQDAFRSRLLDGDGRFAGGGGGGSNTGDSGSGRQWESGPSMGDRECVQQIKKHIEDSLEFAPTLVIWMIDMSPSATGWHGGLLSEIKDIYRSREADEQLLTSVIGFGETAQITLDEPAADPQKVLAAFDELQEDESSVESTFQIVDETLTRYLDYRRKQRKEVMVVLVTDEAGNDAHRVSDVVAMPRKYSIPIYVLGVPAPFGRLAGLEQSVEGGIGQDNNNQPLAVQQGPETMFPERIHLEYPAGQSDFELLDSGFGPFALEQLCRQTGGRLIATRPGGGSRFSTGMDWPHVQSPRFEPEVMRRYLPKWVTRQEYEQTVQSNKAMMALRRAAGLPHVPIMKPTLFTFAQADPARLKQQLDQAQQAPAKVSLEIDNLYEVLREGAKDRPALQDPRSQASFDLAYGRITAAKVRMDGYNEMLAALKRGRNFENEGSTTWVLEPADTVETSSSLRSMIERATTMLQSVVDDHAGTPWAYLAEQELKSPMGWKWTER